MAWSRRLQTTRYIAILASANATATRPAFVATNPLNIAGPIQHYQTQQSFIPNRTSTAQQKMNLSRGPTEGGSRRIDKAAMEEIIEDVKSSSREEVGYCLIDVRGHDEIAFTGKLDDVVETLPLPYIAEGALMMDEEDFKETFGFDKPQLDETLVFTCKAGIRSQHAAQLAKMAGFTDILDYIGGADEWIS